MWQQIQDYNTDAHVSVQQMAPQAWLDRYAATTALVHNERHSVFSPVLTVARRQSRRLNFTTLHSFQHCSSAAAAQTS